MALCLVACAARPPGAGAPLAAGELPASPAAGLGKRTDVSRGVLTYAVAFASAEVLAAIELSTEFALVVYDLEAAGAAPRRRHRIVLGPAELDITDLALDRTRAQAWIASRDGTVRSYDLASGKLVVTWHLGSSATSVAVSADGRHVATGTQDGILCLRRSHDQALLQCVIAHRAPISGLDFHGSHLASCAWDGTVIVWRVPSLAIHARHAFPGSANGLAFAPDGERLAIARSKLPPQRSPAVVAEERRNRMQRPDPGNSIALWRLADDATLDLVGHGGPVTSVAWVADGARLVSGAWDRSVHLWDAVAGKFLARNQSFTTLVRDVAVDTRGSRVAVAAWTELLDGPSVALIELLYSPDKQRTMQSGD